MSSYRKFKDLERMKNNNKDLLVFGTGVGVGLLVIWAAIELFPLIALGGAGFLLYKGLETKHEEKTYEQ